MGDIRLGKEQPRLQARGPNRRLTTVALGIIAAGTLSAAAFSSHGTGQQTGLVGLGGHLLLLGFALANVRRSYARFWWPSTALLALVGLAGAGLAVIPEPDGLVTGAGLTSFGLSGMRSAAQLGAVALTALAWSTAGRRPFLARNSMFALSVLASLQFLAALPLSSGSALAWALGALTELFFAAWLLATVVRTALAYGGYDAVPKPASAERLPTEPWDTLRQVSQYGDILR